jgi:glutamate---cysteine ligase / carboxylate-amine ligase
MSRVLDRVAAGAPAVPELLDVDLVREVFDAATDFTVGIEEEFAIVDPETRSLAARFEELQAAARADEILASSVAGELISAEIEIRSGRAETFHDALAAQRQARTRLFALAERHGVLLGATGTHPWSPWQEQRIIDTDHYHRVSVELRYVAWRNNTFGLHVHVGIRGADRAIAVCDRLRPVLPALLAISANSPFLDGRDSGLASARSQIFTRSFPRCGIPDAFGDFDTYADYVSFLVQTGSIVQPTQIWWSVRPHHAFGTVEVRICDAQTRVHESDALAGLIAASVAQAALDHDDRVRYETPPGRMLEENVWRAIRHGLDGRMIDLDRREEFPAAALPDRLLEWTCPARAALGIDPQPPAGNGAQRQRQALQAGDPIDEVYAAELHDTALTYPRPSRTPDQERRNDAGRHRQHS